MFIGAIHGNERGGVPVTEALARSRPQAGVAYFSISYPNPDGAVRNTRQNIRGVDLNRNFPGWRRNGSPGNVYYPGTRALSEPESRVMYNAIKRIKPTLFVTYHQHMNVIDFGGGNKAGVATYARQTRMKIVRLSSYPGSQATWLPTAYPRTTVVTVELPAHVSSAMVSRHLSAARHLAAHH
jgi:protein MpaA